ncbi:hypothetical protein LguiA_006690 [Lonicera macranthoides]
MGATTRLPPLLSNVFSYPPQLQRLRPFSSTAVERRPRLSNFSDDEDSQSGSAVYRHALKFQRPTTIKWRQQLLNSVTFIGTVDRPIQKVNGDKCGVYTLLRVKSSNHFFFKILLQMWNEMAEISIKYLRPNDFIYVSGHLGMYNKTYENGEHNTFYKLNVNEINYVAQQGQRETFHKAEQSRAVDESNVEKYKNRLHLWQMFFANPHEWWDNRKNKVNPKSPDFKHKDTGEALWINIEDPPWITKQLELYDSRSVRKGLEEGLEFSFPHVSFGV